MNVRDTALLNPTISDQPITSLTASSNTDPIDLGNFVEAIVFLNVTAHSGTTPTLDCKIQYSPDGSNWVDSGDSFTQITTTNGVFFKKLSTIFGRYVRLVFTLSGTTPNYTLVPTVVAKS